MPVKEKLPDVSAPGFDLAPLLEFGQKQINAFTEIQREFCNAVEQANRDWIARAEQEQKLMTDCATKVMGAKTFPEVASVCQEWMSRHMTSMSEDSQKMLDGSQKFMASTSKLWSSGVGAGT